MFFEKIKKEIEKKNHKIYEANISMEVVQKGIQFENLEKLQSFIHDQKINVIFFSKYYDNSSNYVITEKTFKNLSRYFDYNIIDIIAEDIDDYNKKILNINFDEPCAGVISCIFQGQYCFVYLENEELFDKFELIEAEEKLCEIIEKNKLRIDEKKKENEKNIKKLKEEVREKILKDKEFLSCTTKQSRKKYAITLFKEILDDKYKLLKDIWTTDAPSGIYSDAVDFVEMIWKEAKQKNVILVTNR